MLVMINSASNIYVKIELDLFSVPPTQTSIDHGKMVDYHLIAIIVDAGSIEFNISASGKVYLDFANTYLHLRMKIV